MEVANVELDVGRPRPAGVRLPERDAVVPGVVIEPGDDRVRLISAGRMRQHREDLAVVRPVTGLVLDLGNRGV